MDALRHAGRGQALGLRRRLQQGDGRRASGTNAPYTEADLQRQFDLADDLYGAEGAAAPAGRDRLHRRASTQYIAEARLNPRKLPGEYALIGQPAGPRPLEGDRRDRDRSARRRDLRQGRRRRGRQRRGLHAPPGRASARRRARRSGATSAAPTTPRRRPPSHDAQLPLPAAQAEADRPEAVAIPDPGRWSPAAPTTRRRRATRRPPTRTSRPRRLRRHRSAGMLGDLRTRAVPRTRCSSRGASPVGPPARRLRAAGRLLLAADPDGAGPARRPASTPAAPPSSASTSTCCSAAARTTRGRRPRRARTSSTPSPRRSASRAAASRRSTRCTTCGQGPVPRRSRCSSRNNNMHPERRRPRARPETFDAARPSGRSTASSAHRGTVNGKPVAFAACARPTSTRPTRRSASRRSTTPRRCATPEELPGARRQDRLHLQLVLRRRPRHRVLQLRQQPGAAARAPTPSSRTWGTGELRLAGLGPRRPSTSPQRHFLRRPPAGHQPALHHELEQQAGARLRGGRGHVLLRLDPPLAVARRAHRGQHRRREEDEPGRADRRDGGRRHRRPARQPGAAVDARGAEEGQGPGGAPATRSRSSRRGCATAHTAATPIAAAPTTRPRPSS